MKVSDLDKRICDVEEGTTNTQTYRKFIKESEKEFGFLETNQRDYDKMTDEELTEYIELLDELWLK